MRPLVVGAEFHGQISTTRNSNTTMLEENELQADLDSLAVEAEVNSIGSGCRPILHQRTVSRWKPEFYIINKLYITTTPVRHPT
jgi:hypothetical protein